MVTQPPAFPSNFASKHVRIEHLSERKTVIVALCPKQPPCVTREVLDGLRTASRWLRDLNAREPDSVRHMILASDRVGVFSLGGDLDFFVACVAAGVHVRRMVETGEPIELNDAYSVRMIDELAPRGRGIATAHRVNEGLAQGFHARMATRYALALAQGPMLAELESIAHAWVDVAFKINLRDMRLMHRLATQQLKLGGLRPAAIPGDPLMPAYALAAG